MIVLWVEMPSVPCRLSFFLELLKQILRTNARQVICCIKRPTCIKRSPRHSPCVTAYYRFNCIFATYEKKCLRTARHLQRGMLTFGIVLLYDFIKKKETCPSPFNNHKMLSHLELNFKRRLITVDGRIENWGTYNNSLYLAKNMNRYLSADIICSKMRTVFRKRSLRKTVSIKDQIMSKDKYPDTFLRQIEDIVFIILQIFCNAREKMFTNSSL